MRGRERAEDEEREHPEGGAHAEGVRAGDGPLQLHRPGVRAPAVFEMRDAEVP